MNTFLAQMMHYIANIVNMTNPCNKILPYWSILEQRFPFTTLITKRKTFILTPILCQGSTTLMAACPGLSVWPVRHWPQHRGQPGQERGQWGRRRGRGWSQPHADGLGGGRCGGRGEDNLPGSIGHQFMVSGMDTSVQIVPKSKFVSKSV